MSNLVNLNTQWLPGQNYIFYDPIANLYKIGLSKNAPRRRYYLSLEYQSDLKVVSIVRSPSMRLCEKLMHHFYQKVRVYRGKVDGGTEWFNLKRPRLVAFQMMAIAIALWMLAILALGAAINILMVCLFGSSYAAIFGLILIGIGLNIPPLFRPKPKRRR